MNTDTTDPRRGLPSASGMHRLAACHGSHMAQQGLPDTGDAASSSGTAIHAVLAGQAPMDSLTPEQQDIAAACLRIEQAVTEQWMERHRINPATVATVRDSRRMWLYDKGQKVASGLADVIAYSGHFGLVMDFKTMSGDHGTAADNMQLRALAVMASNTYDLAKIDVAIIQPLVTWTPEVCSYDWPALMRAEEELLAIVAAANAPDAPRNAGAHCGYCRASATCPAVHREIETMARAGHIVFGTLELMRRTVRPGLSTQDLDAIAEEYAKHGKKKAKSKAKPARAAMKKVAEVRPHVESHGTGRFKARQPLGEKIRQTIDETLNSLKLVGVIHWAEQNVVATWVAGDGVGLYFGDQQGDELIVNRFVNQDAGCRGAVLTGIEVTGDRDLSGRLLKVCVFENDYRGLATKL